MRVKSHWFKSDRSKTPEEIAGAVAFIAWRIAQNGVKQVRRAEFEISVGPQYFEFLITYLVFLIQVADRVAFSRFDWPVRVAFTTALAHRVADIFSENQSELLEQEPAACRSHFIERLNRASQDYADYDYEVGGTNYPFLRLVGHDMEQVMTEQDQRWVAEQMIAVEAPEGMATLEKALAGLLDDTPRPARRQSSMGGE
jgi:hypothetical protein